MISSIAFLSLFVTIIRCSSTGDLNNNNNNHQLTSSSSNNALSSIPSNNALSSSSSMLRHRNSRTNPVEASPDRLYHSFDQYDDLENEGKVDSEMNPIRGSFSGSAGQSAVSRLFLPVAKPNPSSSDTNNEQQNFMIDNDDYDEGEVEELDEDLISQIPETFTVTETSGTYESYEDDSILTSAEVMKKRSALYRLLSKIYSMFDTFDFEEFRNFLREAPSALNHQSLKYNLIENLVQRSLKTSNEDTWQSLSRLVEIINEASIARTVGDHEHVTFAEFKHSIKTNLRRKSSKIMKETLENFIECEQKRLFPLNEAFSSDDFESAKRIIESSNRNIWISISDFIFLLDRPNSDERYAFMKWAISHAAFNVHERYTKHLWTPLMLCAMHQKKTHDVVKAILEMSPSSVCDTDSLNMKALHHAKDNDHLSDKSRKSLVKMLKLENPTVEELDAIMVKYSTKL